MPRIYFGSGKVSDLPLIINQYGNSVILVTGKHSFVSSVPGQSLIDKIKEGCDKYTHVVVSSEPSPEIVDQAVSNLNNNHFDVVVAIGGGSVMDAGKAISAMMYKTESLVDFLEGVGLKTHPGTKIPFIAVPTTSGTGSEATKNAVISRLGKNGFKKSLRHDKLVPDIAIVDPQLTLNCPASITAASGMDCFTQLTEAYLSDKSNEYTDAFAIEGIKAVKSSLLKAYIDGSDVEARTGISFAALTSGICLTNAGLGIIHGFASSIGAIYDIPHGVICGTMMAVSNAVNVRRLREISADDIALKKYAVLGKIFLGNSDKNDYYYIDGFISYLYDLTEKLHLPGLKELGVEESSFKEICISTENKNNPVKLDINDLTGIISERFI